MLLPSPVYEPIHQEWINKVIVLWGSWLVWPCLAWLLWRAWRHGRSWSWGRRVMAALWAMLLLVFIDARFIERYRITVHTAQVPLGVPMRIALISDMHIGLYKSPAYLARVVARLNELQPDAVLIAGDFTYEPDRPLDELMAPLSQLTMPAYSVPGNHDEQAPGPDLREPLRQALLRAGVRPVEYSHADLGGFTLVGLGDRFAHKDGLAPLLAAPQGKPIVLLMHNPDSVMQLKPGMAALALAGHTHGGQIRIPGLYKRVVPSTYGFDRGLHAWAPVPTYVSTGLGEIGLPMRWLVPPVIDMIDLR